MQIFGMGKPSVGVVYDASFGDGIDSALALALLYGLQGKNESRVISVSVSRNSLNSAIFASILVRFYTGEPSPFMGIAPIGLTLAGKAAEDTPMLAAVVGKESYPRDIKQMNDTADPVATIRNALSAQYDQNAIVVLAGPATNLAGVLALPGASQLIKAKVRHLVIAGGAPFESDAPAAKAVLTGWPGTIVMVGAGVGNAIPFPAASIEKDFAWSDKHPLVEAWHVCRPEGGDAPAPALAAALYAVRPDKQYFQMSDGGGKPRTLIADPAKKEAVQQAYSELASTKPVGRPPRMRPQQKKQ
jgi:hypothetical protein